MTGVGIEPTTCGLKVLDQRQPAPVGVVTAGVTATGDSRRLTHSPMRRGR